ncbi:NeuD/PglB/VioB family sugar acetyltransferase [Photobacterium nomapromontoriensis]|uniref:NeuD/PglB/VioB family sugar acetyltransferase n=1 Tax=Photobacterium nomapromontoriensis TaxID=2910237 RepID=UPI003D0BC247
MIDLILVGGGGHCAACIDVIELQGRYRIHGILDSQEKVGDRLAGYPFVGTDNEMEAYVKQGCHFLITVGQIKRSRIREQLYHRLKALKAPLATVISPRAHISRTAQVAEGGIIMHDALVNAGAQVEENSIINSKALIEHDVFIGAHCHISTGAVVNGGARVAAGSFVGSNAVIVQGITTTTRSFIKAGTCYKGKVAQSCSDRIKASVLTTIFPIDVNYVHDYFASLVRQTEQFFDVILVNDGFGDLSSFKAQYAELNIIELSSAGNIAKNRQQMCQYALDNQYEVAIFADIDDYFSENRISTALSLLSDYDIVVNDLTSFNDNQVLKEQILSQRVVDGEEISLDFIRDKNIFGLSNTAMRLSGICRDDLYFPRDLVAVDWYLFSKLLCQSKRAVFTNQSLTYYRQHQINTVGIGQVTPQSLQQSLTVREIHFKHMLAVSDDYQVYLDANNQLKAQLNHASELDAILNINQTYNDSLLWWEVLSE